MMEISQLSRNLDVMHGVESRFYPPVVSLDLVDDDGGSMMYGSGQSSDVECRGQGQLVAVQRSIKIEPLETAASDRHHCSKQGEYRASRDSTELASSGLVGNVMTKLHSILK